MTERVLFTVPEVAEVLRCGARRIYDQIKVGKIRARRNGGGRAPWLIHKDELDRLVAEAAGLKK